MAGRKRRGLSPEDRALWERLKATVDPLHRRPETERSVPVPPETKGATVRKSPDLAEKAAIMPGPAARPSPAVPTAPRMDRRRYEKLRRGRMQPEARIDLHGMSVERAHATLNGFIASSHASGHRLVLVITGKGIPGERPIFGEQTRGILRRSVPHWLAMAPNRERILHVAEAHRRHGGEGALYVYLVRQR